MQNLKWCLLLLLVCGCLNVGAEEKVAVGVRFKIEHPDYVKEIDPAFVPDVEQEMAGFLVGKLNDRAPFLDFHTDPGDGLRLEVILDAKEKRAEGKLQEVGLHFRIRGSEEEDGEQKAYWTLRDEDHIDLPIGNGEKVLKDVKRLLEQGSYDDLILSPLNQVSISQVIQFNRDLQSWKLKHTYDELCIKSDSELQIRALIKQVIPANFRSKVLRPLPAGTSPPECSGCVHCLLLLEAANAQFIDQLLEATDDQLEVTGVHLVKYRRRTPCHRSTRPEESGL